MLKNDFLEVEFDFNRAEVISIKKVGDERNLTWCRDEALWNRANPVLFPVVSQFKNHEYSHKGITYSMKKHGFARESRFNFTGRSAKEIVFTLEYSEETLKQYPFEFQLDIVYTLEGNKLTTECIVKNLGEEEMFYFIGGHPSFTFDGSISDYSIEFENPVDLNYYKIRDLVLFDELLPLGQNIKEVPLNYDMFANDALVFPDVNSKKLFLKNNKLGTSIEFEHNFDLIALWTKKDYPFICIEPWNGHGDLLDEPFELSQKSCVMKLLPNESQFKFYSVKF